jgi:hypothetical protein
VGDPRTLKSTLAQLGLALLNATLLLCLAIVVMVWLALGRVQDLAQATRITLTDALAPSAARLERIATGVESMDARLAAGTGGADMREAVAGLRKDISDTRAELREASQIWPQLVAGHLLQSVQGWMAETQHK